MTWVNRYNAKENLQTVTETKGPWINGKFDARMSGGCNIFGYDTTIWENVKKQDLFMFSTAEYKADQYEELAKLLKYKSLNGVYYSGSSGSDAVETAVRIAFDVNKKNKIVSRQSTWHGGTILSSSLGNHRYFKNYESMYTTNVVRKPMPDNPPYTNLSELVASDLEFLKQQKDVSAFICEPLPTWSHGFKYKFDRPNCYNELREYCDKNEIVLIFDEVMTGFKTGKRYFTEYLDIEPDLLCLSKGITAGVIPFSTVLGRTDYLDKLQHGHTWSGHYLGVVAAIETVKQVNKWQSNILDMNKQYGHYFDNVLGCFFSTDTKNIRFSDKIIYVYKNITGATVFTLPLNIQKEDFDFLIKEVIIQ